MPWQLVAQSVATLEPPHLEIQLGPAIAVLTDPSDDTITIKAMAVEPGRRRQGHGRALIEALRLRHPHKSWRVPVLVPEEWAGLFEGSGFERAALSQSHMSMTL